MPGTTFDYDYNGQTFEGYLARPKAGDPAPLVLVAHAWGGQGAFEREKADALATLGYAGFAIDVYGKGKRGSTVEENQALMNPLVEDRAELQARLAASLSAGRDQGGVDTSKAAAVGYCFGGLCVLDLARMGAELAGVVSFHGLFTPPPNLLKPKISAKVLALHGWEDPMAEPDAVLALAKELSAAGADWQLHAFGGALHAFTNPDAADPAMGVQYDAKADRRSWRAMANFLEELFG